MQHHASLTARHPGVSVMNGPDPGAARPTLATAVMVVAPLLLVLGRALMLMPSAQGFTTLWTVTHVMYLAGTVLMIPAALAMRQLAHGHVPPLLRDAGVALVFVGALALGAQFVVDLMVAVLADGDPQAGGTLFDQLQASAPVGLTLYTVGPSLLFVGLMVQAAGLARVRTIRRWAAIALVVGPSVVGVGRATGLALIEVAGLVLIAIAMATAGLWAAD
jgi:hypothetical protein